MIRIGPAGTGGDSLRGMEAVKEDGLSACEIEFTHGVHMKNELAKQVGELAEKLDISLSVHAPFFINLASEEKIKIKQSEQRILQSCERGHYLGAKYIVFHAAFYGKRTPEEIYTQVKESVGIMQDKIDAEGWKVSLCPETTGKGSQFGDLDELLRLKKETKCHICVDFAHLRARTGTIDYDEVFKKIRPIGHIHSHFSGIEYTAKGERKHLITPPSEIKELFRYILKYGVDITIINESPDPFGDSIKMMRILKEMK